jgi:sterol desaturase/sphingolipid hydroxylase (fatty acid hydroxylase superfamily)
MDMQNAFQSLNWLAVVVAAVSAFALGGLWYSPMMFAKRWMKETGITEESAAGKNMVKIFGLAFILSFIAAFFLAMFWCCIWRPCRIYGRNRVGIHIFRYQLPV